MKKRNRLLTNFDKKFDKSIVETEKFKNDLLKTIIMDRQFRTRKGYAELFKKFVITEEIRK